MASRSSFALLRHLKNFVKRTGRRSYDFTSLRYGSLKIAHALSRFLTRVIVIVATFDNLRTRT